MADKWKDLSQSNKKAHLDSTMVVSYGTGPTEQALQSLRHATLAPVLSLDIIFIILSLLPTELVLRLKTVCRAWSQLISDPSFIRAHSSHPAYITGFFSRTNRYRFNPFETNPRFPSMITAFLSSGFKPASTSHGLVCFQRNKDRVIIVANPATSHWAVIPSPVNPSPSPNFSFAAYAPNLIYDPKISLHFKVAVGVKYMTGAVDSSMCDHRLRFHVYSSETSSWIVSSIYPSTDKMTGPRHFDLDNCKVSRRGGGSVCWEQLICLWGYEIASDTHWDTLIPRFRDEYDGWRYLASRDGEIYCACFDSESKKVKVLRLDEKKNWVLEGECNSEELQEPQSYYDTPLACYDNVRKALILEIKNTRELVALHLSSSRIEFVGKCESKHCSINLPHSNTLAPFHGSKQDGDGLNQLLRAVEPDDDSVHDVETDTDDDYSVYESDAVEIVDDDDVYESDAVEIVDDDDVYESDAVEIIADADVYESDAVEIIADVDDDDLVHDSVYESDDVERIDDE